MTTPPCKIHWCDALATHGNYCAVHHATPNYDPRNEYERTMDGTSGNVKPRSYRPRVRREPDPVDQRPLIVAADEDN